ncbi:uncharacterized protein EHS24_003982 [Apiotrichum porosum]|uniref:Sld7 C-terminal domain-containing protein n=1 Tax=Apiotrichum porosum TaxID=105984 RepID=A0A427Y3Z6_9TREE|nr:uncharacterized protein EHS24_003982 [Apiotrichum porosum]RSH85802.1 hypothetical protein EHS24_003982 [Apiotrichum porosum]
MAVLPDAPGPSPSKRNPFARPHATESTSFSRTSLLPTRVSVRRIPVNCDSQPESSSTAASTSATATAAAAGPSSTPLANPFATPSERARPRNAWRLLWRGGLEVGPDGWRLDGITFFAQLAFPAGGTPSTNPFAPPTPSAASKISPAANTVSLPGMDTDLCLSFESMRGRKYFQVRGVVPLTDEDIDTDDSPVQMSITSPLLSAFFTGILCRAPKLSPQGRTTSGVVIGLGDEGIDSNGSSVIVYGQRQTNDSAEPTLRLCVGRRRIIAPPKKVRPGEPLPRAPVYIPAKPVPGRGLSRAPSAVEIYGRASSIAPESLPVAALTGRTGGRHGEKRPRKDAETVDDADKRRKAGRIVPERLHVTARGRDSGPRSAPLQRSDDEDIFGRRSTSLAPRASSVAPRASSVASRHGSVRAPSAAPYADAAHSDDDAGAAGSSTMRPKRPRVPQQVLDNKATIRKQTHLLLDARGCPREHEMFKDVFGMTTKGTYFALRAVMEAGPVDKTATQDIIERHLDMYLPAARSHENSPAHVPDEPTDVDEAPNPRPQLEAAIDLTSEANLHLMRTPPPKILKAEHIPAAHGFESSPS